MKLERDTKVLVLVVLMLWAAAYTIYRFVP